MTKLTMIVVGSLMIRGREMLGSGWPPSIVADDSFESPGSSPCLRLPCDFEGVYFTVKFFSIIHFWGITPTYTNYIHGFEVRKLLMSPRQKNPVVALHMTVPKNRVTICPSRPFLSYFVRLSASNSILHRHWANQHPTSSRTLPHLHICRGPPPRPCQQQP